MTIEQQERVTELVVAARALPPLERQAFVAAAAEDPDVRAEVIRRLEYYEHGHGEESTITLQQAQVIQPFPPSRAFVVGQIVGGRYRIEQAPRAGGMGEVYLARDLKLDQQIALKTILQKHAGDADAIARFRRELVLARAVTHPNVCRVFDFGEDQYGPGDKRCYFLTMEFLRGETLGARLHRVGRLEPVAALSIIRGMCEGLAAAHRAGVIHRDFKPENVMLVANDASGERPVVTDFGLARSFREGRKAQLLTQAGQALGTPHYMAPEQWAQDEVFPATDVYSLGIVIHEMVTGQRPALSGARHPLLPAEWDGVIRRCLQQDPAARPQSPLEVAERLEGSPLWRMVAAIIAVVVLATLLLRLPWTTSMAPGTAQAKHVVVLPFHAAEGELQVFADGLAEAITQRMSQYEGPNQELLVAPASETRRSNVRTPRDAKTQFGANIAVEGSLYAEEGRLRLLLAVIDTATMRQVETAMVEGNRSTALAVQDAAVAKLASAMRLRVRPANAREQPPVAPGAHELYLSGRGYLWRNDQLASVRQAVALFRRAAALDPKYALAQAGLSEALWREFERTNNRELVGAALDACRAALALNEKLPDVNVSCGRVMAGTGKAEGALRYFEAALALDPRNGEAMEGLGRAYESLGNFGKAEAALQDMVRLRSADWQAYKQLGLFWYRRERFADAAAQFQRVVELTPDNAQGYSNLGVMLSLAGRLDEARRALERSNQIEPRPSNLSNLGKLLFDQGKYSEAAGYHLRAVQARPESHILWGNLAAAYYWAHDARAGKAYAQAIELAEKDLKVNPKNSSLPAHLAHYCAYSGKKAEAEQWLEEALRAKPASSSILARDAMTADILGRKRQAKELLDQALQAGLPRQEAMAHPQLKTLIEYSPQVQ